MTSITRASPSTFSTIENAAPPTQAELHKRTNNIFFCIFSCCLPKSCFRLAPEEDLKAESFSQIEEPLLPGKAQENPKKSLKTGNAQAIVEEVSACTSIESFTKEQLIELYGEAIAQRIIAGQGSSVSNNIKSDYIHIPIQEETNPNQKSTECPKAQSSFKIARSISGLKIGPYNRCSSVSLI